MPVSVTRPWNIEAWKQLAGPLKELGRGWPGLFQTLPPSPAFNSAPLPRRYGV